MRNYWCPGRLYGKNPQKGAFMKIVIQGGLIGGLILFLWSALSWVVLPFHEKTLQSFQNEMLVESALMASLDHDQGGVYILPSMKGAHSGSGTEEAKKQAREKAAKGPFVFAVISPKGWGSMPLHSLIGFLTQALGAALVTGLLLKTGGMKYWGRVGFVVMFAFAVGVIGHLPHWNWWGFPMGFTLAEFLDLLIGWFLAGLAIAKVTQ